jgi:hypothetical protein
MKTRWKDVIVVKKLHWDKCEELKKLIGKFEAYVHCGGTYEET